MPRIPLDLTSPFLYGDGRARGFGQGRLRGPDVGRPHHGVRASPFAGALAYTPLLRVGDRYSHTTAAQMWPLPLPRVPGTLHVTSTSPVNAPRGSGVIGHETAVDRSIVRHGMPLSTPVAVFIELATQLDEDDLVAIGDALVLSPAVLDPLDLRPWITLDELREGCADSRSPGCRRARRAAARVRQGGESREETLLRLMLIAAGLPEPELQVEIFDARGFVGRFDMVYRAARVIVEYDGDQHRTSKRQYEKDLIRIDRAIEDGWTVIRVRAHGLFRARLQTVARVRRALAR